MAALSDAQKAKLRRKALDRSMAATPANAPLVRRARLLRRMTQQDVADRAGLNVATVVQAEAGRPVSNGTMLLLAYALHLDLDALGVDDAEAAAQEVRS
jgi:transcriptional regulator with XRE-family HTH domain